MSKGLVAHVPGAELIELCGKQAAFHRERSDAHRQAADALQDVVAAELQYGSMLSPKRAAQDKTTEHANKARYLDFLAAHVNANETYELSQQDLVTIGVLR